MVVPDGKNADSVNSFLLEDRKAKRLMNCNFYNNKELKSILLASLTCYFDKKRIPFYRVCTERMMDHQYGENGARNIHSNIQTMIR